VSDVAWFNEARFGMFVHWGAYSVAGRGEWVLNRERIPYDEYIEKYVNNWKAERYDPRSWCRLAKAAGMRYMLVTTRHHDGFALWDTKTSDFNAVKMGPKKDLIRMYADAARAEGLGVGFYYSYADWHHADYPGACFRDWPDGWHDEAKRRRFSQYYRAQIDELLTNYGKVDIFWYDGCIPLSGDGAEVNRRIKELQPGILVNDRNGEPYDFRECEQAIRVPKPGLAWEACFMLNDSWGYHAGDRHYKTPHEVVRMLTETAAGAGNLVVNVGPKPDGTIPAESSRILWQVGAWLKTNGEFLYGSTRSPFSWNNFGRLTTKGNKVYVHIFHGTGRELCIAEIANKVLSAKFLATGKSVAFDQQGERLFLRGLPARLPDPIDTVIVLEVDGESRAITPQTSFWIPG